jgi:hypothetical protein
MVVQNFTSIDDLVHEHLAMKHGAGGNVKESLPISSSPEVFSNDEQGKEEAEEAEVSDYVTPQKDVSITLPPALKSVGVQVTNDDGQFNAALYKLKLPISDEKIMEDLKAKPSESKRWYATILLYMLQMAHLGLKKVGSKVVRVIKTN